MIGKLIQLLSEISGELVQLSIVILCLLGPLVFVFGYRARRQRTNQFYQGVYHPADKKKKTAANVKWFKEVLPIAEKNIKIIAGELNPIAYKKVQDELTECAERGVSIAIVFGPKLVVSAQKYKKFYLDGQKENENTNTQSTAGLHPILEVAAEYPQKIKLYLTKNKKRFKVHCGSVDGRHACIEESHDELDERGITFYRDKPIVAKSIADDVEALINSNEVISIDPHHFPHDSIAPVNLSNMDFNRHRQPSNNINGILAPNMVN